MFTPAIWCHVVRSCDFRLCERVPSCPFSQCQYPQIWFRDVRSCDFSRPIIWNHSSFSRGRKEIVCQTLRLATHILLKCADPDCFWEVRNIFLSVLFS